MNSPTSVEEIAAAIERMSHEDREKLIARMANIDDLLEDLEDVLDLVRAAREGGRPYEEFLAELRAV